VYWGFNIFLLFCLFSIFSTAISRPALVSWGEHGVLGHTVLHVILTGKIQLCEAWMLVDSQLIKIRTVGHCTFTQWLVSWWLPFSVMLSEYLLMFIHTYLNFKIFGNFFFPAHIFNFMQSHIVKTALEKTTWGEGLQGVTVFSCRWA
jgi:hypothetical protein